MNIIISGPQGSGKGTQAKMLAEKCGYLHLDNGSMLRKIAAHDEEIRNLLDSGNLVPDKKMLALMDIYLSDTYGKYENIIFDGFPRTTDQYVELKKWLTEKNQHIDYAVVLLISEDETVRRLSARRVHKTTGEIYNLITKKPPEDILDEDLVQRDDDKPDSIRKRLALFNEKTKPLFDLYRNDGILVEINGEQSIEDIFSEIVEKVGLAN